MMSDDIEPYHLGRKDFLAGGRYANSLTATNDRIAMNRNPAAVDINGDTVLYIAR